MEFLRKKYRTLGSSNLVTNSVCNFSLFAKRICHQGWSTNSSLPNLSCLLWELSLDTVNDLCTTFPKREEIDLDPGWCVAVVLLTRATQDVHEWTPSVVLLTSHPAYSHTSFDSSAPGRCPCSTEICNMLWTQKENEKLEQIGSWNLQQDGTRKTYLSYLFIHKELHSYEDSDLTLPFMIKTSIHDLMVWIFSKDMIRKFLVNIGAFVFIVEETRGF